MCVCTCSHAIITLYACTCAALQTSEQNEFKRPSQTLCAGKVTQHLSWSYLTAALYWGGLQGCGGILGMMCVRESLE